MAPLEKGSLIPKDDCKIYLLDINMTDIELLV